MADSKKACIIDGCNKTNLRGRGLCGTHYSRLLRTGSAGGRELIRGKTRVFLNWLLSSNTDECILWPFAVSKKGYGVANWNNSSILAHRLVLLNISPPPSAKSVAAHAPIICHNRLCVNPKHLRWASHKENSFDRRIDGTMTLGESANSARMDSEKIIAIYNDARSRKEISEDYGISVGHVGAIKRGKSWGWLTNP